MKPEQKVREDVIRGLQWDAQVPDHDAIGVAVKDGAVTLTGHVTKYAQKNAAAICPSTAELANSASSSSTIAIGATLTPILLGAGRAGPKEYLSCSSQRPPH
jgi:BON domain